MRAPALLIAVVVFVVPVVVRAAAVSPPGVNLRWDRCFADAGAQYKDFACDTNSGSDRMIGSFELATAPALPVSGLEVYMNLASLGPLPSWWQFKNAGTCRTFSLGVSPNQPAGAVNCLDWADGQAAGGIAAYNGGNSGPSTAQIIMAFAVPVSALATLNPGQEYFAFSLQLNHAKTVGTGSCSGCLTPVVVFLSAIRVTTQSASADFLLTQGANWSGSPWVSWQQGYPIDIVRGCDMDFPIGHCGFPFVHFTTVAYDPTPTRATTWGQVKALYR